MEKISLKDSLLNGGMKDLLEECKINKETSDINIEGNPFSENEAKMNPFEFEEENMFETKDEEEENPFDRSINLESMCDSNEEEINIFEQSIGLEKVTSASSGGSNRYINAMSAFIDYKPISLSIDRYVDEEYNSITYLSNEPVIVIEKLQSNMISMIHNLYKRVVPAMLENKSPIITWKDSIKEYVNALEEEITLRQNLDEEEFRSIKKLIILEDMNDKMDLNQNEEYISRQDVLNLLLNKYDSIVDLTNSNCSIHFKDDGNKYSFNIGGLGYDCSLSSNWSEEIKGKIKFIRNNKIMLFGLAASNDIVESLRDVYGFDVKGGNISSEI